MPEGSPEFGGGSWRTSQKIFLIQLTIQLVYKLDIKLPEMVTNCTFIAAVVMLLKKSVRLAETGLTIKPKIPCMPCHKLLLTFCYSDYFVLNLVGMSICKVLLCVSWHVILYDNSKMILSQDFSSSWWMERALHQGHITGIVNRQSDVLHCISVTVFMIVIVFSTRNWRGQIHLNTGEEYWYFP